MATAKFTMQRGKNALKDVVVAAGTQFMTEGLKVKLGSDATQQSADAGNTQLVR